MICEVFLINLCLFTLKTVNVNRIIFLIQPLFYQLIQLIYLPFCL